MSRFTLVSLEEGRRLGLPPRQATQELYRQYVRQLAPEAAGRLELEASDRPITERARLKAAARAEAVNLHIERRGNTIVFWISDEPPQPRARPSRGRGRGRTRGGRGRSSAS